MMERTALAIEESKTFHISEVFQGYKYVIYE